MGKQPFDGKYEWMRSARGISGRAPEIQEVASRLGGMIREAYPTNEVPPEIVRLLHDCESSCQLAEERVKVLIETVSNDLKPETAGMQYHQVVENEEVEQPSPPGPLPLCPACGEKVTGVAHDDDLPERGSGEGITRYRPCGCPFGQPDGSLPTLCPVCGDRPCTDTRQH